MKISFLCLCHCLLGAAVAILPFTMQAQSDQSTSASGQDTENSSSRTSSRADSSETKQALKSSDSKFVREAAEGGLAEVELGKLATEKASSNDVKQFGQRMVDDHSKANVELKQLARNKEINLPQDVSAKDKALKERLSKLSGQSFDKAYMENMVKDHKKDVADFAKESSSGADPEVKGFATKTLPTLKDHLREAEGIASGSKASASTSQ